jgi:hypothetical protein
MDEDIMHHGYVGAPALTHWLAPALDHDDWLQAGEGSHGADLAPLPWSGTRILVCLLRVGYNGRRDMLIIRKLAGAKYMPE